MCWYVDGLAAVTLISTKPERAFRRLAYGLYGNIAYLGSVPVQIVEYCSISQFEKIQLPWDILAEQNVRFVPSFAELKSEISGAEFRAFVGIDESEVKAIACFVYEDVSKRYHLGATKLFDVPARKATLYSSCILGEPTERFAQDVIYAMTKRGRFDYIDFGRIFLDTALYSAIKQIKGVIAWRETRKDQLWWMILLPRSFDDYLASLRERTRSHIARDCRSFERRSPTLRIMTRPEEMDVFLRDAEAISRATYQWKLSYGLANDEPTRQHFLRLARAGVIRCYLTYLDGEPCSFGWGDLHHGKFYFRQTGYHPKFRKFSPGTGLMIWLIKDMIEHTNCKVFHFQWGGEHGYKARLGTTAIKCASVNLAPIHKPYSLVIVCLDQSMKMAKNLVGLMVERGPLKQTFRSVLRRLGVGTF